MLFRLEVGKVKITLPLAMLLPFIVSLACTAVSVLLKVMKPLFGATMRTVSACKDRSPWCGLTGTDASNGVLEIGKSLAQLRDPRTGNG